MLSARQQRNVKRLANPFPPLRANRKPLATEISTGANDLTLENMWGDKGASSRRIHLRRDCVKGQCRRAKGAGVTERCVHNCDEGGVKSCQQMEWDDINTKIRQYLKQRLRTSQYTILSLSCYPLGRCSVLKAISSLQHSTYEAMP